MKIYSISAALAGLLAIGAPAKAEDAPPAAYACTFEKGNSWSFDGGAYKSVTPSPLTFEITAINLEKQAADLSIDGKPAGKLRVVRALNANSFLEVANEGFLNLTTVYDRDETSGTYPAVHSRHFGVIGQPVFAQYAGSCKAK
ncbi:MAG: hypothetical protein ABL893_06440 [Hyphomicrobium sp.]